MSDLQRQWAKAKIHNLSPFNEEDEEQDTITGLAEPHIEHPDDDSSSASSTSSTGTVIPEISRNLFARPNGTPKKKSLEQIPWTLYFERELFLQNTTAQGQINHHIYLTSPTGNAPLFVTHHGAGSSGLSFAALTSAIRKLLPEAGILSLDARGHGSTTTIYGTPRSGDLPPEDLSLSTLSSDLLAIIQMTSKEMVWKELPPLVFIGHSLGGAVVTDFVNEKAKFLRPNAVLGYAVLDVVEGSAIDALQSMQTYLSTRPTGFATLEQGIDWHIRTRTIRNSTSARISVPALLKENLVSSMDKAWLWRTDLGATQPFWENWFVGLSKKFLAGKGGKLLLLAGTDRLDTELMIGQMQGKYALQVFPEAGHFIHEDQPDKTANVLVDFYKRNDRSALVLPPKLEEFRQYEKAQPRDDRGLRVNKFGRPMMCRAKEPDVFGCADDDDDIGRGMEYGFDLMSDDGWDKYRAAVIRVLMAP